MKNIAINCASSTFPSISDSILFVLPLKSVKDCDIYHWDSRPRVTLTRYMITIWKQITCYHSTSPSPSCPSSEASRHDGSAQTAKRATACLCGTISTSPACGNRCPTVTPTTSSRTQPVNTRSSEITPKQCAYASRHQPTETCGFSPCSLSSTAAAASTPATRSTPCR